MSTNEERKELAAMLRKYGKEGWVKGDSPIFGAIAMIEIEGQSEFAKELCDYLADLIEPQERTCRNNAPSYLRFLCSECGYVIYHDDANETGDKAEDTPNHCPNCGKVVE